MAGTDITRDEHPDPSADDPTTERGTNEAGTDDDHPAHPNATLPPADPNYRPSNIGQVAAGFIHEDTPRRRIQNLTPYLFVRAVPGDRGARPLWPPTVFWESCDIHLMPAGPGGFDFSQTILQPVAGQTYRVFVHVWNLGRLAAYGARLRVWWVDPGFFNGAPGIVPNIIGGTYLELGDRDSAGSHGIVEIPTPWTVVMNNAAHECLLAAVDSTMDPWDGVLDANAHRHVGQRNLSLVGGVTDTGALISRLATAVGKDAVRLVVSHASVHEASFEGARERGLSKSAEPPGGWNHSGLRLGREEIPIGEVRWGAGGAQYFDLTTRRAGSIGRVGAVGGLGSAGGLGGADRLGGVGRVGGIGGTGGGLGRVPVGTPVVSLSKQLPDLLRTSLGVPDMGAATLAAALGGPGQARVLRFGLTDSDGRTGGYSILVAP